MTGRSLSVEVVTRLRSGVWELSSHLLSLCVGTVSAMWLSGDGRGSGSLMEILLLLVCTNQICEQQKKAAKKLKEPSHFKGSHWWNITCLRLNKVPSSSLYRQEEMDASNGWKGVCTRGIAFKVKISIWQCPRNLKVLREGMKTCTLLRQALWMPEQVAC